MSRACAVICIHITKTQRDKEMFQPYTQPPNLFVCWPFSTIDPTYFYVCLFSSWRTKNSTRDAVYGTTAWSHFREQKLATTRCDSPAAVLWNNAGHQTAAGCKETETLCPSWRCLSGAVVRIEWTKQKKTFFFSVSWTVRLISVPALRTCVNYARAPNPRNWRTVTLLAEI